MMYMKLFVSCSRRITWFFRNSFNITFGEISYNSPSVRERKRRMRFRSPARSSGNLFSGRTAAFFCCPLSPLGDIFVVFAFFIIFLLYHLYHKDGIPAFPEKENNPGAIISEQEIDNAYPDSNGSILDRGGPAYRSVGHFFF